MAARKAKPAPGFVPVGGDILAATLDTATDEQVSAPAADQRNEENTMQNSIQNGETIIIKPQADVKGGDLVVFPAMVAVAVTDIKAGDEGAGAAGGVFDLPKDGTALAKGQAVYATAAGVVTATESGNTPAGKAWADAAGGDSMAQVKINA